MKKKRLRADYLIVPGDISDRAQPEEFELASTIISECATAFGLGLDRILFVPGNHDVDWAELKLPDTTGFRRSQRYAALRHKSWIFHGILESGQQDLLEPPFFALWQYDDLLALGYNSAWHDEPDTVTHHGLIAEEHVGSLAEFLEKVDLSPARLRLFFVHHHPVQYSDPIPNEPDFSAMTNSPKLLKILQQYNFDLLVHGHKHAPKFATYSVDGAFPLAILAAGSFSATLDPRWSGYVNNQFHMIEIAGRDENHECIYGLVRSWTYLCGHGWLPSESNNGIRHLLPFGTYSETPELLKTLQPILEKRFSAENYVLWSSIVSAMPNLTYLPPERVIEVIDKLAGAIGFHRHGDPPDDVVLLKG